MQKNINDIWLKPKIEEHSKRIIKSYAAITGHNLFDRNYSEEYISYLLYHAPYVVVSHGMQIDSIFNYANKTAQQLWKLDWEQFTLLPSRLSAEPERAEDRQRLLDEATTKGYIDNYEGIPLLQVNNDSKYKRYCCGMCQMKKMKKLDKQPYFVIGRIYKEGLGWTF
jgi:hypothetical protein